MTLPPGLEVKESSIPNAVLEVFATNQFPLRSRFGPYQGTHVTDPDIVNTSAYCWQVCHMAQFYCFEDFQFVGIKVSFYFISKSCDG